MTKTSLNDNNDNITTKISTYTSIPLNKEAKSATITNTITATANTTAANNSELNRFLVNIESTRNPYKHESDVVDGDYNAKSPFTSSTSTCKFIDKNDPDKSTRLEITDTNSKTKILNTNKILVENEHKRVVKHTRLLPNATTNHIISTQQEASAKAKAKSKSVTFLNVVDELDDGCINVICEKKPLNDDDEDNKLIISGSGYIIRGPKDEILNITHYNNNNKNNNTSISMSLSMDNIYLNDKNNSTTGTFNTTTKTSNNNSNKNEIASTGILNVKYVSQVIINIDSY